jgi:hypothetical protein
MAQMSDAAMDQRQITAQFPPTRLKVALLYEAQMTGWRAAATGLIPPSQQNIQLLNPVGFRSVRLSTPLTRLEVFELLSALDA